MARNYLDSIIGKSSYTGQRAYNVADAAIDAVIQNMNRPVPNTPAPQPTRKTSTRKRQAKPKTKKTIDVSKGGEYIVKAGDTLSSILKETTGSYKNYREIAKANGISDPNKIYAGMKIKIPGYNGTADSKQDATPAVSGTGQGSTGGAKGGTAAGASSGSAVAKQDSLIRNTTKTLADSAARLQTAARDTISRAGSTRIPRDTVAQDTVASNNRESTLSEDNSNTGRTKHHVRIPKYVLENPELDLYSNMNGTQSYMGGASDAIRYNTVKKQYPQQEGEDNIAYHKRLMRQIELNDMARKSGAVKSVYPEFYALLSRTGVGQAISMVRGIGSLIRNLRNRGNQQSSNSDNSNVVTIGEGDNVGGDGTIGQQASSYTRGFDRKPKQNLATVKPKQTYSTPRTSNIKPRQPKSINTHVGVQRTQKPAAVNTRRWQGTSKWGNIKGWGQPGKGGWQTKPTTTSTRVEAKPADIKPNSTAQKKWNNTFQHKQARGWQHVKRRR